MTGTASHLALIKERFPNLQDAATITSPPTPQYNCVAYAAGDMKRWWWPDAMGIGYWPPGCMRLPTLPVFQIAFEKIGFSLCANGELDPNARKIAVFHAHNVPTHAAKLLKNGKWSSKLGKWFDISHTVSCLNGYQNEAYGEIAFFMSRPVT